MPRSVIFGPPPVMPIRMFPTRRIIVIAFTAAFLLACEERAEPELALNDFAAAVNERRCSDAIELLSERTRYSLERLREKPQHPHNPVPLEEYYCSKFAFEHCNLGDMSLKKVGADTATVTMPCGRTQDSILPGFTSIFLKYEPRDWELVREEERWRVVLPMVIRVVEVREQEDHRREQYLREREERLRKRDQASPKR